MGRHSQPNISLANALRRGTFPHQLSWLIDNPLRRLIIRPETLADRLPIKPQSRILEVGCGSGYFSTELATRVPEGRLDLFDLHPQMLQKALAKFGSAPPSNLSLKAGDAAAGWPFEEESFDIVLMVTVLGELGPAGPPLQSARRVLAGGGILAIHEHWPDPDFQSLASLRPLVQAQGFRFVSTSGSRWNHTSLFAKQPT